MKKITALLLTALLLCGCQARTSGTVPADETTTAPTEIIIREETTVPMLPQRPAFTPTEPGDSLSFSNPGKTRIPYTGNVGYVKYITSLDQLPDVEALQGYDAEFFADKALLIVVETVTSGSVRVDIDGICLRGDTASVKLKRTMSGDVGTADMATWLLWAEVDRELDYTWTIQDRTQPTVTEGTKY